MSPSNGSVQQAAELLLAAQRPAILLGPEAAGATRLLLGLAERLGAALLTTPDAKSLVDHSRSCGTFSFGASLLARRVVQRADVILAISALGEFSCRLGEAFKEHRLIQIAERVSDVGRNLQPSLSLVQPSIEATVQALTAALFESCPSSRRSWFTELAEAEPGLEALPGARPGFIHPIAAMAAIQAALPPVARVCLDVTSGALHAYEHLTLSSTQRVFSSIENSACMGEALMASLGVRLASNLPTLTIVGDWGYCMAPSELHTAVELELAHYVVLIWANGGGAFIGAGVEQQGIRVPDEVWRWHAPPDFAAVARAFGAAGVSVRSANALESELRSALDVERPVVIEAHVDPDVPVPAGDRFLTLGEARK